MKIIDLTAGTRSMWFDTEEHLVTFCDKNPKDDQVIKCNWADRLPFDDESFDLVVFDPPHLTETWAGTGEIAQAYGYLLPSWESDLTHAFHESFRIVKGGGMIIFKWNTRQFSIQHILALIPYRPLFGHTSAWTNKSSTIWAVFVKGVKLF